MCIGFSFWHFLFLFSVPSWVRETGEYVQNDPDTIDIQVSLYFMHVWVLVCRGGLGVAQV